MIAYPILWREVMSATCRRRLLLCQIGYQILLGVIFLVVWPTGRRVSPMTLQAAGDKFLSLSLWIQCAFLVLGTPAMAAASLSSEKEQKSLQILLLSGLGEWSIVLTKSLVALLHIGLLLISGIPVLMLGLFFGGITPTQLFWGLGGLAGVWLIAGQAGVLAAALFPTFPTALLGAYSILVLLLGLLPVALAQIWPDAGHLVSPLTILYSIFADLPDFLGNRWAPALVIGSWVGLAFALLWLGCLAMRFEHLWSTRRQPGEGSAPSTGDSWQMLPIGLDRLMVWRELRGKRPDCTLLPLAVFLILFGVVVALDVIFWKKIADPKINCVACLALCLMSIAFTLFASAASMLRERRRGELDMLLLTNLETQAIVEGKYEAIFASVSPVLFLPIVQASLGGESIPVLSILLILLFAFTPAAILAGMGGGWKHSTNLMVALGRSIVQFCSLAALSLLNMLSILFFLVIVGGIPLAIIAIVHWPTALALGVVTVCYFLYKYNDNEVRKKVLYALSSQLDRGGTDIEWRGLQWTIGWGGLGLAAALWIGLGLLIFVFSNYWRFGSLLVPLFLFLTAGAVVGLFFSLGSLLRFKNFGRKQRRS